MNSRSMSHQPTSVTMPLFSYIRDIVSELSHCHRRRRRVL